MNKINVGLVQIGDSFGENQYYLPYSVGLLQAYAQKYTTKTDVSFCFGAPIFKRVSVASAVELLADKQVALFSTYLWNFRLSLEIAKRLKELKPDIVTVFGGPQAPEDQSMLEEFLRKYPFIDIASYGEGERSVLSILENFQTDWLNMRSVGFLDRDKKFVFLRSADRINDLNEIPSPYLEGVFDELIAANPEVNWSAMWETNRGCPFTCSFCAWGANGKRKVFHYDDARLSSEIDWFAARKIEFIFCCDANFGMFARDIEIAKKVADSKAKIGYPKAFSVQNTKNSKQDIFELQKVLNDAGLQRGVNLALQSVNAQTLKSIKRSNISSDTYNELQVMFTHENIPTFSDMILGLPDETYESFTEGIAQIIASGQHNRIQFINLTILENTEMAEKSYIEKYGLVISESKIISHHTSLNDLEEVYETQQLVVGTSSMPVEKWIEARVFCWLTSLLYFNKLLQIPFMAIDKVCGLSCKTLVELFMCKRNDKPTFQMILNLLRQKAEAIRDGECEYVASKESLNIWWPIDEFVFLTLAKNGVLDSFYREAQEVLCEYLRELDLSFAIDVVVEALSVNQKLIKQPFLEENESLECRFNILDFYTNLVAGRHIEIEEIPSSYEIERKSVVWKSWDEWCLEVVWYGTKRGAYMYGWFKKEGNDG